MDTSTARHHWLEGVSLCTLYIIADFGSSDEASSPTPNLDTLMIVEWVRGSCSASLSGRRIPLSTSQILIREQNKPNVLFANYVCFHALLFGRSAEPPRPLASYVDK